MLFPLLMPLRGVSVVLSIAVLCLKTAVLPGQLSGDHGGQVGAGVFQETENILRDINHQLLPAVDKLNARSIQPERVHDGTVAIWITWPVNDTVLPVGSVVLAFETRGFPSGEIPIEVLIPQNGDGPTVLMVEDNAITLSVDVPYTQLVTLSATARGQRVSTSVLFSTTYDKATIVSSRVPLPDDAVWGVAAGSPLRERPTKNNQVLGIKAGAEIPQLLENTVLTKEPPSPISLVFLGSLRVDGQKHIWLQQLERLSRARFTPKYLTFHDDEATRSMRDDVEAFKRRIHDAGVPLVRASLPKVDSSSISEINGDKSSDKRLIELGLRLVLESLDSAGGNPHLMSPPWTRDFFLLIADAVKSVSPDVLVVANGATLGDVVLTRAARWAMGNRRLKIVLEFPNLKPVHGVDVDVLVTPSHYVARHPDIEALAESTRARVVVIPPGIQVASSGTSSVEGGVSEGLSSQERSGDFLHDLACSSDLLADLGCRDPDCHVVGFAGRLAPEKGPGLFVAVAEVLAKLLPCTVFVVAGDGPLRLALEAMAERLGLASRMHFVGWVDGADLEHLLAGMSLLFNPSLMASETFSVINIQAMAVGTPVATFGTAGILEYVSPNVNALVLDDAEPRKVATELAELLLDRPRLDAFAERGKTDILSNFGADTAVERWAELYESLV